MGFEFLMTATCPTTKLWYVRGREIYDNFREMYSYYLLLHSGVTDLKNYTTKKTSSNKKRWHIEKGKRRPHFRLSFFLLAFSRSSINTFQLFFELAAVTGGVIFFKKFNDLQACNLLPFLLYIFFSFLLDLKRNFFSGNFFKIFNNFYWWCVMMVTSNYETLL